MELQGAAADDTVSELGDGKKQIFIKTCIYQASGFMRFN